MTEIEPRHVTPKLGPGLYAQWRRSDIGVIFADCLPSEPRGQSRFIILARVRKRSLLVYGLLR